MALTRGARLGQYEIGELIGAGGMGQVYKAFDRTLNRPVAIKILPELVAGDPDRLARFEREAQVLAALNHPLIAQVYGFEQIGHTRALVMELVEGPTLEERLAQGPMPIAEALPVARQIAEALEAAHEVGIVHRDLKPANIKIRADDTVKVLDFGLAKALDSKAGLTPDALNSPTLTARATELGVVLGTAAYMSPEQAKGKAVDRRADVWAFGVVLYEILTARRLFNGEDVSDTMASVLRQPLDLGALPPATPPAVRSLIERCLERDTKQRLRDIGEARVLLERVIAGKVADSSNLPVRAAVPARARTVLPWLLLAAVGLAAGALVALQAPWTSTPPAPVTRVLSAIGADAVLQIEVGPAAVLSPDGRSIVFRAQKDGVTRLYLRRLDQLQATPLPGTEGAESQFFSPDGQWIAFFADRRLKKTPNSGGAAVTLCDSPTGRGGTWAEDGTIIFQSTVLPNIPLQKIPAIGGSPAPATTFAEGEVAHRWPQALPGGRLLYTGNSTVSGYDTATLRVQDRQGQSGKVVLNGGYHGRYLPSGHLLYVHRGTLYAVRFDLEDLEAVGQAVPVIEGIAATTATGGAQFSVASNGTLVYVPGRVSGEDTRLHWMTADGKISPMGSTPADWESPHFSSDGSLLAMDVSDGRHRQIAIYDPARDQLKQLTFDAANHRRPVWTPDRTRIVYASDAGRPGVFNLYWRRADGTDDAQRLTDSPNGHMPTSVHPSGRFIAFSEITALTPADIWILPLEGDEASGWKPGKAEALINSPWPEGNAAFSPDGRWIAYSMSEQGNFEVLVRPYPLGVGQWRVSTAGGTHPVWSPQSGELFYTYGDQILVAPYNGTGTSFQADKPRLWARGRYTTRGSTRMYDVHPDGKRVVLAAPELGEIPHDRVVFVFNFLDELRRLLPAEKQ